MLCGTPAVLGLAALDAALDIFAGVELADVEKKSIALSGTFITLAEHHCADFGLALATPRDPALRGSQVCFSHPHAYAVMQALIASGVIGDFRAPDILRFGFAPLYLRYVDVWGAVTQIRDVLANEIWREPRFAQHNQVT